MSEKRLLILIKQYTVITTVLKVYSLVFGWFEVTLLVTERVTELVVISKPHSFEKKIISNMSLIGKQVIHKNFQSESFYFFWFPGAPIVAILVSYWLENYGTNWETMTFLFRFYSHGLFGWGLNYVEMPLKESGNFFYEILFVSEIQGKCCPLRFFRINPCQMFTETDEYLSHLNVFSSLCV